MTRIHRPSIGFKGAALAGAVERATEAIPPLHPPRGQLRRGFRGNYAWWMLGTLVPLCLGMVVLWRLRRRSQVQRERWPAETVARHDLEVLRSRTEDNALLADVVRVLRRYFVQTLPLPGGEPTTLELCRTLRGLRQPGAESAEAAAGFLERCEQHRFGGTSLTDAGSIVETALALVDRDTRERERRVVVPGPKSKESGG